MLHNLWALIPLVCVLNSCQTSEIKLDSVPAGATVEVLNPEKQGYEEVGKTPYIMEGDSMLQMFNSKNMLSLRISKPGYVVEHVFIDKSNNPKVDLHTQLKPVANWQVDLKDILSEHASAVASRVQVINGNIHGRRYEDAMADIRDLLTHYPQSYFLYDMKGSVHVLRGEKLEARNSFEKSLSIFQNNGATKKALQELDAK